MTRSEAEPVAVVVCTVGRSELLRGCLDSLATTLQPGDELIVVESGSDSAASALQPSELRDFRVVHTHVEPPGKSRQLNHGIKASHANVVLFTDDDVSVPRSWRDDMATCFANPSVGLCFGPVHGLTRVPGTEEAGSHEPGEAPFATWEFAHGASMAARRDALVDVGGFDERLGPGAAAHGEEHDLVLRARARGWRVVLADGAPTRHMQWRTAAENRRNALVYERGGGAVVGAALRRSPSEGLGVLRARLAYQRAVFSWNRGFGLPALAAFTSGLVYGLRLGEANWLNGGQPGPIKTRATLF